MINFYEKNPAIYFPNVKAWVSWAIVDLNDYIMFFILNIFVIVVIFMLINIVYQQNYLFDKILLEKSVKWNIENHSHAPYAEFYWTFLPIILLIFMGWPSFHVLYAMEQLIDPFHTIIITGNQWYWSYEYSDLDIVFDILYQFDEIKKFKHLKNVFFKNNDLSGLFLNFEEFFLNFDEKNFLQFLAKFSRSDEGFKIFFDSLIISEESLPKGYPRLLSTDQILILPNNVSMRFLITSSDVIHSWAMPSLGIKMDAVPGRINQVSFICPFWGTYWGQCSELCGINHGFMPIEIKILSFFDYLYYLQLNTSFKYENFALLFNKISIFFFEQVLYKIEIKKFILNFPKIIIDFKCFLKGKIFCNFDLNFNY